jgi:hypothetical protein
MKAIFRLFIVVFVAAASGVLATVVIHLIGVSKGIKTDVSYTDFISITLTALGLMITVLGFFVAAAGVIGWATLESKLKEHSFGYFSEQLGKEGPLRKDLEQLFSDIAYAGIEGLKQTDKEEGDYSD